MDIQKIHFTFNALVALLGPLFVMWHEGINWDLVHYG